MYDIYHDGIKKSINEKIEEIQSVLFNGRVEDFDQYKYFVGYLQGLEFCINESNNLVKKLTYDEGDD